MDDDLYVIGEVARRTGLLVRTIRFYADEGIVPPAAHSRAGYRLFDLDALNRLDLVRTLRDLGLPLATISGVLEQEATLSEVAAVAAVSQCLVDWLNNLIDRGYTLPVPRTWVLRENKWRAARHGVDAEIIIDEKGTLSPLRTEVSQLVEELTPVARRLDCEADLQRALVMAERPSYVRQRDVVARGGSLRDVVDSLIVELRTDTPS